MNPKRLSKIIKKLINHENTEDEDLVRYLDELKSIPDDLVLENELITVVKPLKRKGGDVASIAKKLLKSWKKLQNDENTAVYEADSNMDSSGLATPSVEKSKKSKRDSSIESRDAEADECISKDYSKIKATLERQGPYNPPLVTFANGILKDHSKVKFSYFTVSEKKRLIVCEGSHLVYRSTDGDSIEKFQRAIGIRDPETGIMTVIPIERQNLFPDILLRPSAAGNEARDKPEAVRDKQEVARNKEEARKERIKMFGSRKANMLENRLEKIRALPGDRDPIKDKLTDEEDEPEAEDEVIQNSVDNILPDINPEAENKADVYPISGLITREDWKAIEYPAKALYEVLQEEDSSWKEHFTYNIKSALENREKDVDDIRLVLYLHYMIQMSAWKAATIKKAANPFKYNPFNTEKPWDAPASVAQSLIDFFTSKDASGKRVRSKTDKDKLTCYMFAVALHTENNYIVNVERLKTDAQIPKNRVVPLAKLMQLHYCSKSLTLELKLPLPAKQYPKVTRKKR